MDANVLFTAAHNPNRKAVLLIELGGQDLSTKRNTRVEYVHGTGRREFYELMEMAADLETVRRQWASWEDTDNRLRPHESLGLKTPMQDIRANRQAGPVPICPEPAHRNRQVGP